MYDEIVHLLQTSTDSKDLRLTPDEFAQIMEINKPHLIRFEEELGKIDYGEVTVSVTLRAGKVSKMEFTITDSWMPPKPS